MASTDTNTAGSPIAAAATPPTAALAWRWWCTSESSSMIWRRPRSVPRRSASHFMKQFTSRSLRSSARGRDRQIESCVADRLVDAVGVERVSHQRVPNAIAAACARLVADEHDLRLCELDAGRARGDGRVKIEILAELG